MIDRDADGQPRARRHVLGVHVEFATRGIEGLPTMPDRAINDMAKDLLHEQHRRAGTLHELGGWDPNRPSTGDWWPRKWEREP